MSNILNIENALKLHDEVSKSGREKLQWGGLNLNRRFGKLGKMKNGTFLRKEFKEYDNCSLLVAVGKVHGYTNALIRRESSR